MREVIVQRMILCYFLGDVNHFNNYIFNGCKISKFESKLYIEVGIQAYDALNRLFDYKDLFMIVKFKSLFRQESPQPVS